MWKSNSCAWQFTLKIFTIKHDKLYRIQHRKVITNHFNKLQWKITHKSLNFCRLTGDRIVGPHTQGGSRPTVWIPWASRTLRMAYTLPAPPISHHCRPGSWGRKIELVNKITVLKHFSSVVRGFHCFALTLI